MRAKVHPHRTRVNAGIEQCVSLTPDEPGGRARYYGYVHLEDAEFRIHKSGVERAQREQQRNVHAWCVGRVAGTYLYHLDDSLFQNEDWVQVTYHYNIGRFITLDGHDVTDESFQAAVCNGRNFYVKVS